MRYLTCLLMALIGGQLFPLQTSWGQEISVHLPDTLVLGNSSLSLPITATHLAGHDIISLEFTISYDSTVIRIDNIVKDNYLANIFSLFETNTTIPGKIVVAGASAGTPLTGEGILLAIEMTFLKEGVSSLIFEDFVLDPGNPPTQLTHGRVRNISLTNRIKQGSLPTNFTLLGNYPNPFTDRTWVIMDLSEPAEVGIQVFNLQGQKIYESPARHMQPGSNQHIELNLSSTPAGTYIYRVLAHTQTGYSTTNKFITILH